MRVRGVPYRLYLLGGEKGLAYLFLGNDLEIMIGSPIEFLPDNGIIGPKDFFHINGPDPVISYRVRLDDDIYFPDFKIGVVGGITERDGGNALVGQAGFLIESF
jgi:hypothetical protein